MMKNSYFDESRSIAVMTNENNYNILRVMADRFIGEHPETPYLFKVDYTDGIKMNTDGYYVFNIGERFKDAPKESRACARGRLWSYHERNTNFRIKCMGPTACFVNGELRFLSTPNDEGERGVNTFFVPLNKGYNEFIIVTQKTPRGFGCHFGSAMPQWEPYLMQASGEEYEGQLGLRYTVPYVSNAPIEILEESKEFYYPINTDKELSKGKEIDFEQALGDIWQGYAYAIAKLVMKERGEIRLTGTKEIEIEVSLNGEIINLEYPKEVDEGEYTIVLQCRRTNRDIKMENIQIVIENGDLWPIIPVLGYSVTWLYVGVLEQKMAKTPTVESLHKIYEGIDGKKVYWKPAPRNMELRPCVESELYGRFTYPMGVTLYGMLETAKYLNIERYKDYVINGVRQITEYHTYAMFDKERNGFPSLNQQICWLRELDDCGSFGSLTLETLKYREIPEVKELGKIIANHMMKQQRREADATFSRENDTMWIDDLYMSIPFLVRYAKFTGERKYFDEACRQMLQFKEYFFIKEKCLMSHIFDTRTKKANLIPWGRGNGWVIFSLSELLHHLPENHEKRPELIEFFHEMASGLMSMQGTTGMWNQVLDDKETYIESSATAMFICAFSRSIQEGYAKKEMQEMLRTSALRAWRGLTRHAIDEKGNLYGVCQGSGCSFSREYYKKLSWRYNDAHGIGIVLMAGVEAIKLEKIK